MMDGQAQTTWEATAPTAPARRRWWPWFPALSAAAGNERPCVVLFACHAFLLLVCYYVLKTLREPLLLAQGTAELKSYAYATIALVLLVLVPTYSVAYRAITNRARLVRWVTLFFVSNIAAFCVAGRLGFDIGFAYYVWVGVFGVTIVAQFWGYASDVFSVASGRRVFPAIAIGAALGGLIGPLIVGCAFAIVGPWSLLIVAAGLLLVTLPVQAAACAHVPEACRNRAGNDASEACAQHVLGGLTLVLRDRYLLLLAGFVVLLNCVNTTGDYLLADMVVKHAEHQVMLNPALSRAGLIATFYGNFYLIVNALSCIAQVCLAARLLRWIGVSGALLVLPIIAVIGYGLLLCVPIFGALQVLKVIENATDYSIANTSRHTLFLPLEPAAKYEGKIAIDTFCCRIGDLLQAAIVFAGIHWLHFGLREFTSANAVLAIAWLTLTVSLARRYRGHAPDRPPRSFVHSRLVRLCMTATDRSQAALVLAQRALNPIVLTAIIAFATLAVPMPTSAYAALTMPPTLPRRATEGYWTVSCSGGDSLEGAIAAVTTPA